MGNTQDFSQICAWAILGSNQVSSIQSKDRSSNDQVSYATSRAQKKDSQQTASRTKGFGKISSKNMIERRDMAHKFSLTIKNARKTFLEADLKVDFKQLRDRKQVEVQRINQSNITQHKSIVYFDRTN